jgi:hypothetical protein
MVTTLRYLFAEPKTQKEKVKEALKEKPKSIKEIAQETKILEPNVRRILGVGEKEGTFTRVDKGVYVLSKDGQDIAFVEPGNAVESLARLAKDGFKADMVFLDIPYDTPAVKGGNRGVEYNLISVGDFGKVLDSVKEIVREGNSPVIHMFSQAPSGMKAMQRYNDLFIEKGLIPVGKGELQKTFKDGSLVTNVRGEVSKPEGILVFTKDGTLKKDLKNLNFKLVRPKGYSTEKPAEMLREMIGMTTEEGDMVLDPFAGSGVTGAEAVKAGRKSYSIEKNKEVAETITKPRIENAVKETKVAVKETKEEKTKRLEKENLQAKIAELTDSQKLVISRYYPLFEQMFEVYDEVKDEGELRFVSEIQEEAMDRIEEENNITDKEREFILDKIAYMGEAFVESKERFTEYFVKNGLLDNAIIKGVESVSSEELDAFIAKGKTKPTLEKDLEEAISSFNETMQENSKLLVEEFDITDKYAILIREIEEKDISTPIKPKDRSVLTIEQYGSAGNLSLYNAFTPDGVFEVIYYAPEVYFGDVEKAFLKETGYKIPLKEMEKVEGSKAQELQDEMLETLEDSSYEDSISYFKEMSKEIIPQIYREYYDRYNEYPIAFVSMSESPYEYKKMTNNGNTFVLDFGQSEMDSYDLKQYKDIDAVLEALNKVKNRGKSSKIIQSDIQYEVERTRPMDISPVIIQPEVVEARIKKPQYIIDIQDKIGDLQFDPDTGTFEHEVLSDLSKNLKEMSFYDFKNAIEMIRKSEVNNFIKEELTDIVKKYQKIADKKPMLDTDSTDSTIKTYGNKPTTIPNTSEISTDDGGGSSDEATSEISGYDRATMLAESGDGLGADRTPIEGVKGKKARQLINEQVEALLEAQDYSTNSADYSENDKTLMMSYTGAGGKESVGAEGAGLLNEYYTPFNVIDKMWEIARRLNPAMRTAFEPSVGTGRIIERSPESVQVDGAEISKVSGTIASVLYPDSNIIIGDFQELFFDKKTNKQKTPAQYDVVIGNPPFGDRAGFLKGKGEESNIGREEEYFIKRGLDMTKDGGYLVYVVNSSFLKTGASKGKMAIGKLGQLVVAYRLPEDSFEDTSIGTDIVVFKKLRPEEADMSPVRVRSLTDDTYFNGVIGANNILGETKTRKNRFGQMETYVEGDLNKAMEDMVLPMLQVEATEVAPVVKKATIKKITKEDEAHLFKKKERKTKGEVVSQVIQPQKDVEGKIVAKQSISNKSKYSELEIEMFKRLDRDGSIPNPSPDEMQFLNYESNTFTGERYTPDNLYFAGEIYQKLTRLEKDKQTIIDTLGEAQYEKQKAGLTAIIPKAIPLKDIAFDPIDRHLANFTTKIEGKDRTILNLFNQFIRFNDIALSPRVGKYDVLRYVQGERASKDSKPIMGAIKNDARRLFNQFIKNELDVETQAKLQDKFNLEKNGYVRPDFSSIPVEIKEMSKTFRGNDFQLSPTQKDGVAFLVNKGSGLIAYGVGVGKTHTLALATKANMDKGWTKRPLFIVPKSTITKTWIGTLKEMFPTVTINNLGGLQSDVVRRLKKEKGEDKKEWIKDGEISVISHEGILRLGFTEEELRQAASDLQDALWKEEKTKRGDEKKKNEVDEILGQAQKYVTDTMISDLGFDHISVDEVHNFRKVFQGAKQEKETEGGRKRYGNVIGGTPSKRAQQLFLLSQYIQKNNKNRNVFLASATPFENHATEVYNILSFIARDRMKSMGILNINDFFSTFANFEVELDRKLDGTWIDREKMKSFANLSSLQGLLREFIDYQEDPTLIRPDRKVFTPHLQMSELQTENLARIQSLLRGEKPQNSHDEDYNMMYNSADDVKEEGAFLKASTYSIANSVSPYFIKEYVKSEPTKEELIENSPKIKYAIEVVKTVKNNPKTAGYGTFIYFGKMGVSYHPMIRAYIIEKLGFAPEEVAVLSGDITDDQKEDIKDNFNKGVVKVLLGGDQTKEGIDLQENGFITLNLALGWNPTEVAQVEGRVWRQGNKRTIAPLIYPLVENSGDATIYNKFEEKGGRINDLFSYRGKVFDIGEIDPAEKKLALLTDPKDKANMQIEIDKSSALNERILLENDKKELIRIEADKKQTIEEIEEYTGYLEKNEDRYGSPLTENEVKEYKKELKLSKARLERLDARLQAKNITDIEANIKAIEVQMAEADIKIKSINDTYEEKLRHFTELYKEQIKNRKPIAEMMGDINQLIEDVNERTQAEVDALKAEKIAELEAKKQQFDDVVEMPNFVTADRETMERFIASDNELQRRRERSRKLRSTFEVKRGKDFLLAQLEKSKHRKLYAGVNLMLDDGTMTDKEKTEMERKLALDIPASEVDAVAYLVNALPETLFDELGTRITRTGSPTPGRYSFMAQIMEISTDLILRDGGKYSRTITHELWHHLSRFLPAEDVAIVRRDYERQKAKYTAEHKWYAKYHVDVTGREHVVSQEQFDALVKEYPEAEDQFTIRDISPSGKTTYKPVYNGDNYRFKNLDEWFAETMTDRSMKWVKDTSATTKGIWFHMQEIFRIIAEAVRRAFGFDTAGRIFQDFRDGANLDEVRNRSLERTNNVGMGFLNRSSEKEAEYKEGLDKAFGMNSINLRRKDINLMEKTFAQSRDLYLKDQVEFKEANRFMNTSDNRRMGKELLDKKLSEILKPYFEMKTGDRRRVDQALIEGDREAKEFSHTDLLTKGFTDKQKNAYMAVRKAFNSAHALLLEEMRANGVKEEEIKEFERQRVGYLPHKWKYRYAIKTQRGSEDGGWTTESIDVFRTAREADKEFAKRVAQNNDTNTRYVNDTLDSLEVDFFTEQRFSFENMKSIIAKAKTGQDVKNELLGGLRDMIKEKGFGRHFIRRSGIEGYETSDIPKVIANYMSGLTGFITKMEAGKKYYDILENIDARRQKKFYAWMRDSIAYDMGQSTEWNALKQIAFIYHLTNDLSFLLTNATQNFTVGIGELSKLVTGASKLLAGELALVKATTDWAIGNITPEEKQAITGLLKLGRLGGEMTAELMGFKNNPLYRTINNVVNKGLYATTSFVEQNVNRVPAFLAARRLVQQNNPDMTVKEINEKALSVSDDIHFRYGKQHRPEFMRGRKGAVFIFNHYIRSYIYQLSRDLKEREFMAFSKKMFYTFLLSGVAGLPFAKLIKTLVEKIFGASTDDDTVKELKSWELALAKGIPASYLNIDLSQRVGVDVMAISSALDEISSKTTIKEEVSAMLFDFLGAIGGLAFDRIPKGIELVAGARYLEGFGKLLPDVFGNPLKAYQGAQYGVFSQAGKPLMDENGEPFKYTTLEGFIKATGFTPTRETLAWEEQSRQWQIKQDKSDASAEMREKIDKAIADNNFDLARDIQEEGRKAGVLSEDKEYVSKAILNFEMQKNLKAWNTGEKSQATLDRLERGIAIASYGKEYTSTQLSNVTQEFGFRRNFGFDNKTANEIYTASTNKEKVKLLQEARQTMTPSEFKTFVEKGRKTVSYESGRKGNILISDQVYEAYLKAPRDLKGNFRDNESPLDSIFIPAETPGLDLDPPGLIKRIRQAISDKIPFLESRDGKRVKRLAIENYPFTEEAIEIIKNKAELAYVPNSKKTGIAGMERTQYNIDFIPGGMELLDFMGERNIPIPESVIRFLTKPAGGRSNVEIRIAGTNVVAHELLHSITDNGDFDREAFNAVWDEVSKDGNRYTEAVDKHISDSSDIYNEMDKESMAMERFAYLGETRGVGGLNKIPKKLRPFYSKIFKQKDMIPGQKSIYDDLQSDTGFVGL